MGLTYTDYDAVPVGSIIPGRYTEEAHLATIGSNYNRLLGQFGLSLVGQGRGGYTDGGGVLRPYDHQLLGAAYMDLYDFILPVSEDLATYSILISARALVNDVDLRVQVGGVASAAIVLIAAAGWSASSFTIAIPAAATTHVYIQARDNTGGVAAEIDVRSIQIGYSADASPVAAGVWDSGAYPLDLDMIVDGDPLCTYIPDIIHKGCQALIETRPRTWSWSELLAVRASDRILTTQSATAIQVLEIPIEIGTEEVHVWVYGNGPAGNSLEIKSIGDPVGLSTALAGAWVDLGAMRTVAGEERIRITLTSDGANDLYILGFALWEVHPVATKAGPRNWQTTAAGHAARMDRDTWDLANHKRDHLAFIGRSNDTVNPVRVSAIVSPHTELIETKILFETSSNNRTIDVQCSADVVFQTLDITAGSWITTGVYRITPAANGDWAAGLADVDGSGPDELIIDVTPGHADVIIRQIIIREL